MVERDPVAPAQLRVRDLRVRFGDVDAVAGLDLDLKPGTFTALLGPSGCGKSTTLAVLAGLQAPTSGQVLLDGASLLDVPAERRPVSLVLQKPLLFPHLDVARNVGFGLRMAGMARAQVRSQVAEMLARVRLDGYGDRGPGELSGGQEQRVALARALVLRPRVLLLDEPFSQLDVDLRAEMRALVRALHEEQDVITLFVTHDRDEAVEVADRVVLMIDGVAAGAGSPREIYTAPTTVAMASFLGFSGPLPGRVATGRFRDDHGLLDVACDLDAGPGLAVVRPEAVQVGADGPPLLVTAARFAGTHVVVDLALPDGGTLRAHTDVGAAPAAGTCVPVRLPPNRCTVLAADRGTP